LVLAGVAVAGCDGASSDRTSGDGGGAFDGAGAGTDSTVSDAATEGATGDEPGGDAPGDGASAGDGGADGGSAIDAYLPPDFTFDAAGFFDVADYDGGPCNALPNVASPIEQTYTIAQRPDPTGGVWADGVYVKVSDVLYGRSGDGGTGLLIRETLAVEGSNTGTALLLSTFENNSGDGGAFVTTTERLTWNPTSSDGGGTLEFICPPYGPSVAGTNVRDFGDGGIELDIYISTDRIETFAKR
jgi:hypothetical protein